MHTREAMNMSDPESAVTLPDTVNLNDEESVQRILMETVFGMRNNFV